MLFLGSFKSHNRNIMALGSFDSDILTAFLNRIFFLHK